MSMTIEMITEGLGKLLLENHYNASTTKFYEREWEKIQSFLVEEYGDTEYQMERGLKYLERQYGFITKYTEGTLTQQRVQLLRVIHMLEDYSLHKVLTRRYHASKNPIILNRYYDDISKRYYEYLDGPPPSSVQHSCLQVATLLGLAFVAHSHQRTARTYALFVPVPYPVR